MHICNSTKLRPKNYKNSKTTKHTNTTQTPPNHPKPNMQQNTTTKKTPLCMFKHNPGFSVNSCLFATYILFFLQELCFVESTINICVFSTTQLLWITDRQQPFRDPCQKHLLKNDLLFYSVPAETPFLLCFHIVVKQPKRIILPKQTMLMNMPFHTLPNTNKNHVCKIIFSTHPKTLIFQAFHAISLFMLVLLLCLSFSNTKEAKTKNLISF